MTVKTKFYLMQPVVRLRDNKIVEETVEGIRIDVPLEGNPSVYYILRGGRELFPESVLFDSREDLLASL